MKALQKSTLQGLICFLSLTSSYAQSPPPTELFVGSTPCGSLFYPLLGTSSTTPCDFIKWRLTLQKDSQTQAPKDFQLHATYGVYQPNTNLFAGGGTSVNLAGTWEMTNGTKNKAHALVYRLLPEKSSTTLSFVKMDENILHLLFSDKSLMIGTPSHSYTFNKALP